MIISTTLLIFSHDLNFVNFGLNNNCMYPIITLRVILCYTQQTLKFETILFNYNYTVFDALISGVPTSRSTIYYIHYELFKNIIHNQNGGR